MSLTESVTEKASPPPFRVTAFVFFPAQLMKPAKLTLQTPKEIAPKTNSVKSQKGDMAGFTTHDHVTEVSKCCAALAYLPSDKTDTLWIRTKDPLFPQNAAKRIFLLMQSDGPNSSSSPARYQHIHISRHISRQLPATQDISRQARFLH